MSQKKNVIEEKSINDVNYELLKKQFPDAVRIDENGKYIIDKEKLQLSLDPSKADIKEDGYGLNWVGKKEAYHTAFTKNYKVLKPSKEDSKNWDETENILIKGDNLDALKILRHNYFESIKMIYIDPPYNTKNDGFVYNDDFTSSTENTLEELGYDKEYIDYIENIQGAKTHSGWLSFMYPRLLLARDLLKDDGVIFISIDDNEVAQLRLLCDEIFGEENFIAQLNIVTGANQSGDGVLIQKNVEWCFVYAKSILDTNIIKVDKTDESLRNLNDAPTPLETRDEMGYTIYYNTTTNDLIPLKDYDKEKIHLNTLEDVYQTNQELIEQGYIAIRPGFRNNKLHRWRWGIDTFLERKNEIVVRENNNGSYSVFFQQSGFNAPKNIHNYSVGTLEVKSLFNDTKLFEYPKSTKFIKYLTSISSSENDIVLDFFAGSGTTAHAIMDLNAKDGGNRKYICVQWAEETPEKSEARKAGYETIFDITKARIDKAGEKIIGATKVAHPKDQTLFGETEVSNTLDIGFRTFEVVEDAKQKIYQKSLEEMSQEDLLAFTEDKTIESNEEILYNLFVAEVLPLSTKHEELIKDKLYLASNVAFILGDISSDELVNALKDKKECEYITVYSPNISDDKFTLEIESNISKLGIKPDKLRFRG